MNRQELNQKKAKINAELARFEGRKVLHECRKLPQKSLGSCHCYFDDSDCSYKQGKVCIHYWPSSCPNYTNNIRPTTLLAIRKGFELNVDINSDMIFVNIDDRTIVENVKDFKDADDAESYARALCVYEALRKA